MPSEAELKAIMDKTAAAMTEEDTLVDGLTALIKSDKEQIAALLAAQGVSQTAIDQANAFFDKQLAQNNKLRDALTTGTPAAGTK